MEICRRNRCLNPVRPPKSPRCTRGQLMRQRPYYYWGHPPTTMVPVPIITAGNAALDATEHAPAAPLAISGAR
jgi:hypothetical protein